MQRRIMRDAFELLKTVTVGGTLVDLPYEWPSAFEYFTGQQRNAAADG